MTRLLGTVMRARGQRQGDIAPMAPESCVPQAPALPRRDLRPWHYQATTFVIARPVQRRGPFLVDQAAQGRSEVVLAVDELRQIVRRRRVALL